MIWCILESKSAALVEAFFVDFPKNKCNFLHKSKLDIVRRVQFPTGRRPMRSFSRAAVDTIAPWKSSPMLTRVAFARVPDDYAQNARENTKVFFNWQRWYLNRMPMPQQARGGIGQFPTVVSSQYTLFNTLLIFIFIIICIPSPPHSFIPGLKPSFSASPSHRSLPFLLRD